MTNVQDGKRKVKTAADVIGDGVRKAETPIVVRDYPDSSDYLLIENIPFHDNLAPLWKADARQLYKALGEALGLYDHADPCDDTACPCRKAEADDWRDQGLARP